MSIPGQNFVPELTSFTSLIRVARSSKRCDEALYIYTYIHIYNIVYVYIYIKTLICIYNVIIYIYLYKLRLSLAEELRKTPKGTESVLSKALVVISCNADRALCRTHTLGSYARKDLSLKDGLVDRVICSLGIAHITEQNRAGVYRFFKRVRSEDLGLAQLALSHADEPNRIFCIGSAFRSREVAIQNWMTVIDMYI